MVSWGVAGGCASRFAVRGVACARFAVHGLACSRFAVRVMAAVTCARNAASCHILSAVTRTAQREQRSVNSAARTAQRAQRSVNLPHATARSRHANSIATTLIPVAIHPTVP